MLHRSHACVSYLFVVLILGLIGTAVAKAPRPSDTLSIATTSITAGPFDVWSSTWALQKC